MRLFALMFIPLLLASALIGCDDRTGAGEPLREVRIGYLGNVSHAQAVLAVASGDFSLAVAPAQLTTRVFNAGPALIEALFAGEIDVAYTGAGPILNAHEKSRGEAVRIVAGAAANGVLIVARPGSGVVSVADLATARVATPQHGNTQDIAARHYLVSQLKQRGATGVIPVPNPEQAAMMQRGHIDVAWAPEPWGSRLIVEHGGVLLAQEKDLWPQRQFALTLVVTTPRFLAAHPQVVKGLLNVHAQWTRRLQQDPQQYHDQLDNALYAMSGKRLPEGVLARALENVQFTLDPMTETVQTVGQWSFNLGFARQPPDMRGLIDLSLLGQVQEADAYADD